MPQLEDHFFRHEFSKLTALLSHRIGYQHIEVIEDAVQAALISALESWPTQGEPDKPLAWLYRVAYNNSIDALRQLGNRKSILEKYSEDIVIPVNEEIPYFLNNEAQDELLRMIFVCCDTSIPIDSQLVLALKILCGFSIREISLRLYLSEANVYKRLERGRAQLATLHNNFDFLQPDEYEKRLPIVMSVLYQLFTEGYLSSHEDEAIRTELCLESIRLTTYISKHPSGELPEVFALLALMHLHIARIPARHTSVGGLILLEEQNRSLWNQEQIQQGMKWLELSAKGGQFTRYHAEAGIAAAHCLSPSFNETPWNTIVEQYELLDQIAPSAVHRLNWAIAEAELHNAAEGLAILNEVMPPSWLEGSYMWPAVFADLHFRNDKDENKSDSVKAQEFKKVAIERAPNNFIKELLKRRLG